MTTDRPRLPEELGLGAAITFLRRQAGMPQRELTSKLGLSARSNLSDYERGRRVPPPDIVVACEKIFGLHGHELQRLRRRTLDERARNSALAAPPPPPPSDPQPDPDPEPDPDPDPEPQPGPGRRPARRPIVAAIAGGAALLLSVVMLLADPGGHPSATIRASPPVTPQPVRATIRDRTHHDGDDPLVTGCSQDVVTLVQVAVRLPGGRLFGHLLLRHSPLCDMTWGAVWGANPHLYRVYIVASRPSDHAQAASSWAGNTPPGSYGNMLSTASSCVRVSAYVQTPAADGPVARTACMR